MKVLNLKISVLVFFSFFMFTTYSFSQEGTVIVNQDKKITELLNLKKEMNKNEKDSDRYKIQIYSGNVRSSAYSAQKEFKNSYTEWTTIVLFEEPNFKTWVGNFRIRIEADRALKRIKRKFPNAFIFKPKKGKS